ncbi:MAG: hypothetical protein LH616_06105 [Ilumatobacteraceae bacterium]|nr:hypothetical protein [Ilumatobacteraceae bacterium]
MRHAVPLDYVWIALIIVVMSGMWWVAYRMEPHWVSRDGTRFLCTAQELEGANTVGHPRETRVLITHDGALYVTQKRMMRRHTTMWTLVAKAPAAPRKMQVYVAKHRGAGSAIESHLAIRIPTKSRCIAILDDLLAKAEITASRPAPGTAATVDQPDQG